MAMSKIVYKFKDIEVIEIFVLIDITIKTKKIYMQNYYCHFFLANEETTNVGTLISGYFHILKTLNVAYFVYVQMCYI